jgi:phosphoglycerate dehydrogenase-like enzyme
MAEAPAEARYRCVVLDDYQSVARGVAPWDRLADRVDVEFVAQPIEDRRALVAWLSTADIVVANRERTRIDAGLLAELPKLRLIVTTGMRNAAIDVAAARGRGIPVCGTGSAGQPTVELTWALILGLCRHLVTEATGIRQGLWQSTLGLGLRGKTLGLVGLGRVGSGVAQVGLAFGMRVIAWSPRLDAARAQAAGVELAPGLENLFAAADIVSLHAVLNEESRGMVGRDLLAAMRPGALLVNTARAGLVDETALIECLETGRLAGAALDVFSREPLPADHPLRRLPNVLATPHLGYVTEDNYARFFGDAVENIEAWLAGAPIRVLD